MFERRSEPLLPRRAFLSRLVRSAALGFAIVAVSLLIGMAGYSFFLGLGWIDAFLNASMLLGGMGPLDPPKTAGGKLFSGVYALCCGFAVLGVAGVIFAPVFHRFLHRFHLEGKDDPKGKPKGGRRGNG